MSLAGLNQHEVALAQLWRGHLLDRACAVAGGQTPGHGRAARLTQRVGLSLAATLGHRFGEVREDHREPQPDRDRQHKNAFGGQLGSGEGRGRLGKQQAHELDGGHDAADFDHKHHRVLDLYTRVQLLEGIDGMARG